MRQMHLIFFLSFSLVYFRYLKANLIPFGKYVYSIWNSILSLLSFCSVHCTSFTEYLTNGVQELQEHIFDLFPSGRFWVRPGPSVQESIFLSEGQRCHSQLSGEFWFAYHFKLSIRKYYLLSLLFWSLNYSLFGLTDAIQSINEKIQIKCTNWLTHWQQIDISFCE